MGSPLCAEVPALVPVCYHTAVSTICERLGSWAAGLDQGVVPRSVWERAALQRESILAAAQAGRSVAGPFAGVVEDGPLGEVFASATASIAHDWDDYLYMGHTGHSAVAVSRAFAGKDESLQLLAQVAANEVAGRLGLALFIGPHNGQFWTSIHCASGAVAAGVALRLNASQLANALAIALYQPPYGLWPGFMGPTSKLLTAAEPAMQGARAALLAAVGMEGATEIVEDERGLLAHLCFVPRPASFEGLGRVWLTDTIAFKPYPGCAYLQAAVDAALGSELPAAEIERIEIAGGYLTTAMESLGRGAGLRPIGVNFSAALSVAVALTAGRLTHAELDPAWLHAHRDEIMALAQRTSVTHDWELTLATLQAAADGGASLREVPLRAWPRVARRARELHMDRLSPGHGEIAALGRNPRLVRRLAGAALGSGRGGAGALDTERLRMTFPCRVRILTRSGRIVEVQGREQGGCKAPLREQSEVVRRKRELVGGSLPS